MSVVCSDALEGQILVSWAYINQQRVRSRTRRRWDACRGWCVLVGSNSVSGGGSSCYERRGSGLVRFRLAHRSCGDCLVLITWVIGLEVGRRRRPVLAGFSLKLYAFTPPRRRFLL